MLARYRPAKGERGGSAFEGGPILPDDAEGIRVRLEWDAGPARIHLSGTAASLRSFGEYLVALSEYGTNDPDYHEHFDEAGLIVHGPKPDGRVTTESERNIEIEIGRIVDTSGAALDASGLLGPPFSSELVVAAFDKDDGPQVHLAGSRRALKGLGAYLIGLSEITTPGYFDTVMDVQSEIAGRAYWLHLHAPK